MGSDELIEQCEREAQSPAFAPGSVRRAVELLLPEPRYYGWRIVLASFLACLFSSPGQTFLISFYIEPLMTHLGVGRVAISSVYSLATLAAALCLPLAGHLADRLSSRLFFFGVLSGIGVALLGLAGAGALAGVGAAFFVLRLLGQGAIGIGAVRTTTVWFDALRGRALAMGGLGFAFGELLLPGTVQSLIRSIGWQGSLVAIGLLYLVIIAPAISLIMRDRRPEDGSDCAAVPKQHSKVRSRTAHEAPRLADFSFWTLLAGVSLQPFVMTGLIFHQLALARSYGWDLSFVPGILFGFAVTRIFSTYATGFLFERISAMWGIPISGAVTVLACGSVFLPLPGGWASLLYGGLLGAAAGVGSIANSVLWQERYGVAGLGKLQGTVNAVRNGATAAAPPLAAWLAVQTGSFLSVPVGATILAAVVSAGPFIVWMRERSPREG